MYIFWEEVICSLSQGLMSIMWQRKDGPSQMQGEVSTQANTFLTL